MLNIVVVPVIVCGSFAIVPSLFFSVTVYDVIEPVVGAVQETVSEFTVAAVTVRPVGAVGSVQTHHMYGISSKKT